MKIDLARTPVGIGYLAAIGGSVLLSVLLGIALLIKALEPPVILSVTQGDGPRVVTPGLVPDALARDFARDFVVTFETYHPATLPKSLAFLETRFLPGRTLYQFQKIAQDLTEVVTLSRQVSQVFLEDPAETRIDRRENTIEVTLHAIKRVWVEEEIVDEARMVYRLDLVAAPPTRSNPTGLLVSGWRSGPVPKEGERSGSR